LEFLDEEVLTKSLGMFGYSYTNTNISTIIDLDRSNYSKNYLAVKIMLGLYLEKPSKLELREFDVDTIIKEDEVRVRLILGGICGSDVSVYKGSIPHATYPIRPGHELLGEIIEAGAKSGVEVGNRIVVQPNTYCGECEYCLKGKTNICENKSSLGVNSNGGFSEEFTISSKYTVLVPDDVPDRKAVLVEPLSVIVHALEKVNINKHTSVAVIGCGTEGMLALTLTNYLGADITAVDINENKLVKIRKYFKNVETSLPQDVKGKYDIVIEAAGARASVEQALTLVKPGGAMVMIGMTTEATFPVNEIVRREITLYGSIIYTAPKDFLKSIDYLQREDFNVDAIISEMFDFKNYDKAYEAALSGEYGKILLNFRND